MHWEILIIPLIALGVYIFSSLFRSEDDKTKKGVGRRPPFAPQTGGGRGGGRAPGRRVVVTDLDRFLEEARRRREPEERRQAPPPPPSRAPAARPPLRERPARPQEPPRLATPPSHPPKIGGGKGGAEEAVVALPVARSLASPPAAEPVAGSLSAREAPPLAVPPTPSNPIVQQVRSLLSKPQTAATAFVLREIFDRPLCKRRR
jgi:hypothetical protein